MRRPLRIVAPAVAAAVLAAAAPALAIEFKDLGGRPLTIDVTNTAIASYRFNNRNDLPAFFSDPQFKVDDGYYEFLDRFNVQVGYWRLRLNVRLDASAYIPPVTEGDTEGFVIDEVKKAKAAGTLPSTFTSNDAYDYQSNVRRELHTRFPNWVYPTKLSLVYQQPGIDATLGDFYAQLGRGLVLSVRKIDELSVDTTIRGGKLTLSKSFDKLRVGGTFLGGLMNPLRVDEATGRVLNGKPSPLFFGFPEARPLTVYSPGTDVETVVAPRPSYLPDAMLGGRVEAGIPFVQAAANISVLLRSTPDLDLARCKQSAGEDSAAAAACDSSFPVTTGRDSVAFTHNQIRTFSGSLSFPALGKYGDLYIEVAGQQLTDGRVVSIDAAGDPTERGEDIGGYAIYVNANGHSGPLSISLEGKHYRRFFPLVANIDTSWKGSSAPEMLLLNYNQVPTAEPIYVEPLGAPNVCITGGRARADYRFNPQALLYAWLGYYAGFSTIDDKNSKCDESDDKRTNAWDMAAGVDLAFEGGKSDIKAWLGGRMDDTEVPVDRFQTGGALTNIFFHEGYIRYDIVKHITGTWSLESQGFHRRRAKRENFKDPWWEGENYLALQWAPRLALVFGYEYLSQEGCRPGSPAGQLCHYASGGITLRSITSDGIWGQIFNTVSVFVGQRRPAIRCVSGVCRQFPPFEGARLEVVSRF